MSQEEAANALADLANRLATTLLEEFQLDGVILKLHVGQLAVCVGTTSRARAPAMLDAIITGQVDAISDYSVEKHGAHELRSEMHLPQSDGAVVVVNTSKDKKGTT